MMKRWSRIVGSVLACILCATSLVQSVASQDGGKGFSTEWYETYDHRFQSWSDTMNQSYTRYYPGKVDAFRHQGLTLEEILTNIQVNQSPVKMVLSQEDTSEADYIIHAIYSTSNPDNPPHRLITYFIVTDSFGQLHTLVSEQTDTSQAMQFKPTANVDLTTIGESMQAGQVNEGGNQSSQSGQTIVDIAGSLVGNNHSQQDDYFNPQSEDQDERVMAFLQVYFPDDKYRVFYGQGLMDADGSPKVQEATIDGEGYIFNGDENDPRTIYLRETLINQATEREDKHISIIYKVATDEYIAVTSKDLGFNYDTWEDPALAQGYVDAVNNTLDLSKYQTASSDNRLLDLYINRDRSYSAQENEKYLRATFGEMLPVESPMKLGIIYNFEVDGMKNRVNYSEISPGEFSLGQSTGGPTYYVTTFFSDDHIIQIYWHRGPTGQVYLHDKDTYERVETFDIDMEDYEAYLAAD